MNTKKLRQKILDLAIRGKLVPQDPNDEPASVLLERIKAEKERLIKEGKIKRSKKTIKIFDTSNLEKNPFEVPGNWVWCNITSVTIKITDGTHNSPINSPIGDYKYITAKNIKPSGITLNDITYVSKNVHNEIYARCNPEKGDILYIKDGATTGIVTINTLEEEFSLLSSVALIKPVKNVLNKYLLYYLQSPLCYNAVRETMKGVGITRITLKQIEKWRLPLPPLAEQQRIVAEIDKLLSMIDIIENNQNDLQATIKHTKGKILDLAIHGKLVSQDPNDEPASEMLKRINPKSEITCDNAHYTRLPFEVPQNWSWTTLGKIGKWQSGSTPNRLNKDYYDGNIPWLKTGDLNDGYITRIPEYITEKALNETSVKLNPTGSVLIAMYGATIGKIGILTFPATTNQACCACEVFNGIDREFIFLFLLSHREEFIKMGGGGAQPNISKGKIINTYIPLPPFTEQKRIINAVNKIFAQLDTIMESL